MKICFNQEFFSGIFITIGLIIEEDILDRYFRKQPSAMARELLVLKWTMTGFLLTICYKEILLTTIIHIEYEKGLDSIEDVIRSNKPVTFDGNSGIASLLKTDPREQVKEIGRRQKPYVSEKGLAPLWVSEGYSSSPEYFPLKRHMQKILYYRIVNGDHVAIGFHAKRKIYRSMEVLWNRHSAFYLPKASPLMVR